MNALLLIDIQNDFLPGGALAVAGGDAVVPIVNALMPRFPLVVASQDWHPADHGSFAANHAGAKPGDRAMLGGMPQILWPVHCVQDTAGADFAPGLDRSRIGHITRKGKDLAIDSYSAFFDNGHRGATDLQDFLTARRVTHLFLAGLATDYCVKFTALDARQLGYEVTLITDACRGVNLRAGDVDAALAKMRRAGVQFVLSGPLLLNPQVFP